MEVRSEKRLYGTSGLGYPSQNLSFFSLDFNLSLSAAAAAATLREQRASLNHQQHQSSSNNEKGGKRFMSLLAGLLQFGSRKPTPSQAGPNAYPVLLATEASVSLLTKNKSVN